MLRDGLAAEYPSVANALRRMGRPSIPREPWVWAALTGLGAGALTSTVLQIPLIALRMANLRDPAAWAASIVAILAVAIGVAVAWRAGSVRAVVLYVVIHLLYPLTALPGTLLFCDRTGETNCVARLALGQWTFVAGLLLAAVVVMLLRSGGDGRSSILSATGAYVTARQVLSVPMALIAFSLLPAGGPTDPMTQVAYFSSAEVLAAGAAGLVLGIRRAPLLGALIPLAPIALNWALPLWPLVGFEQKPPWFLFNVFTGPVQLVTLIVAQALSRRARGGPSRAAGLP